MTTKRTARPLPQVDEGALRASARAHPRDALANDEPVVLESSAADPELPALQEFEVDEDGPRGSTRKHPGLLWGALAVVAVALLCAAFAAAGDWATPNQAERAAQTTFEEQTVPEDLGAN
ncbi:MAG: hypothetical protein HFJ74_08220 [Eggerthellaceae bacterium]|jgi:ferric-dicitrate binding protein FerR (iron transport regulator)|nr:hypothetical protein [Eggerthellaceae bacterium]